ncbi:hypothetical protein H5T52_08730 [Candidatus Bipolaricaulota bacterium]|nr:hypothetical protein [Candidatus Bipolaricaulota bacterium]
MRGRFRGLGAPPADAAVIWVEATDKALHFIDGVLMATDGLANVRREYRVEGGRKLYKLYASPQGVEEVLALLSRAARYVPIGEVRVGS